MPTQTRYISNRLQAHPPPRIQERRAHMDHLLEDMHSQAEAVCNIPQALHRRSQVLDIRVQAEHIRLQVTDSRSKPMGIPPTNPSQAVRVDRRVWASHYRSMTSGGSGILLNRGRSRGLSLFGLRLRAHIGVVMRDLCMPNTAVLLPRLYPDQAIIAPRAIPARTKASQQPHQAEEVTRPPLHTPCLHHPRGSMCSPIKFMKQSHHRAEDQLHYPTKKLQLTYHPDGLIGTECSTRGNLAPAEGAKLVIRAHIWEKTSLMKGYLLL